MSSFHPHVKVQKIPFGVRMNYVIQSKRSEAFLRDSGSVQPFVAADCLRQPLNSYVRPHKMPIPSSNFSAVILLSEVDLNCKLIARAADQLHAAAKHWIELDNGVDDGCTAPPIDIIAMCAVCLSSSAAIAKMLLLGDRKGKKSFRIAKRCDALMALLGTPALPVTRSLAVRNSWEHLDERLDVVLESNTCRSVSEVHVAVKQPDSGTLVLRHFDPVAFHIKYGTDTVPLTALIEEAKDLSARVNRAFKHLQTAQVNVY